MNKSFVLGTIFAVVLGLGVLSYAHISHSRGFRHLESFSKLPSDKQALLIETMNDIRENNSVLREDLKVARKSMLEALTAENFDADRFQESVNKMHALHVKKMQSMADGVKSLAPKFTQEERQVLAEILPKGRHGRHGRHRSNMDNHQMSE